MIAFSRVSREAREAVYKAIAQLDATTMHTKRTELAEMVRSELQKELDANDKGAFVITAVNVRNLLTDPAIEAAIRAIEIPSKAQTEIAALCIPLARRIAADGFKVCLSGEASDVPCCRPPKNVRARAAVASSRSRCARITTARVRSIASAAFATP